jgi:hypothetical protein
MPVLVVPSVGWPGVGQISPVRAASVRRRLLLLGVTTSRLRVGRVNRAIPGRLVDP